MLNRTTSKRPSETKHAADLRDTKTCGLRGNRPLGSEGFRDASFSKTNTYNIKFENLVLARSPLLTPLYPSLKFNIFGNSLPN